jgi:hypothetical protein
MMQRRIDHEAAVIYDVVYVEAENCPSEATGRRLLCNSWLSLFYKTRALALLETLV